MDPFTLWLLSSVVAPDAYQRVLDRLRSDSAGHRMGARVREQVGRYPRASFRKWYCTEATWQDLIAGGEQSYDSLVEVASQIWCNSRLTQAPVGHVTQQL